MFNALTSIPPCRKSVTALLSPFSTDFTKSSVENFRFSRPISSMACCFDLPHPKRSRAIASTTQTGFLFMALSKDEAAAFPLQQSANPEYVCGPIMRIQDDEVASPLPEKLFVC